MIRKPHLSAPAAILAGVILTLVAIPHACHAAPPWTSPKHFRVLLTVDPRGVTRSNSPASVEIDLPALLAGFGAVGTYDVNTVEVMGYTAAGAPRVFDPTRSGCERYLLPWRVENRYPITKAALGFVVPDQNYTQYAVYFDTLESGTGTPQRYAGMVGDGDNFVEAYGRREVNACRYDTFSDLDGDGDLDIFKGGTEPYIFCYENVGGGKFIDRGKLTSSNSVFILPYDGENRTWHSVEFYDWDNDGDKDLFLHFMTGPYGLKVMRYPNITTPGGPITFGSPVELKTKTGRGFGWSSGLCFVDWDGDGKRDLLNGREGLVAFHRNTGSNSNPSLADGVYLYANGSPIRMISPHPETADIDGDGDLDLFVGGEAGRVYWYTNVGTRTNPVLSEGRIIVYHDGGYEDAACAPTVADFDGDGLLDIVPGRYWERTHWGEQPRVYGRIYKNVGTPAAPRFEERDAYSGAPYTERFQICDAVRQNCVRAVDWNNDARLDLIAGDTDGFVWYFRNTTNQLFPVFATGVRLWADGKPIHLDGEEERRVYAGYARPDVCDWNNDGRKDLIVADGRGWITLYLNVGTDAAPVLDAGRRVHADGLPIDGTARSSVLVCDWNNDGRKDLIFAITGQANYSENYHWPHLNADPSYDRGFLFYANVGLDEDPEFAFPAWVRAGPDPGTVIDYTRPNVGEFIDWDGDGKKDFIGCEFEHNVRFYKNTGTGAPGDYPEFESSTTGIKVVSPFTVQMISGADVLDWNGDGDLDVLTGQGHGGSGLRFYERDHCNDYVNNTSPTVTVGGSARGALIVDAKTLPNGITLTVAQGVVSAAYNNVFYIQNDDRTSGIRVEMNNHGQVEGSRVDVTGTISTTASGERRIVATSITPNPY